MFLMTCWLPDPAHRSCGHLCLMFSVLFASGEVQHPADLERVAYKEEDVQSWALKSLSEKNFARPPFRGRVAPTGEARTVLLPMPLVRRCV